MLTEERALPSPNPTLDARARLAAEWQSAAPRTAEEIARFYQESRALRDDLEAWHQTDERQSWTNMIVHVAKELDAKTIIDIGSGAGHDIHALVDARIGKRLISVEPNLELYGYACEAHYASEQYLSVFDAPLELADLLICIDVLEHVPNPESFLGNIAKTAKLECVLVESTATFDAGTPLHLKENRGWHPGRVLERHGWTLVDYSGRLRVWRRTALEGAQRASMLLCAYRSVNAEMLTSLLGVCAPNEIGWRLRVKTGDALISRSRAIVVTRWWSETNDDVFLMADDDIVFKPADADRLVDLCRSGHDIVCGAYAVHDGGHLACRFLPGTGDITFGPEQPPLEIEYAATGFMAVHRRVIDALVATLPLCHANQPWSFYPLFQPALVENEGAGGWEWLSEDWSFVRNARALGFKCWLDPQTRLTHMGGAPISISNMQAMHAAIKQV